MNTSHLCLAALVLAGIAQSASAQSTGGFSSPSSGAGAAGGSPVGMLLPSTVQTGVTAPTQPGHTIPPVGWTPPSAPAYRSSQDASPPVTYRTTEETLAKRAERPR